MRLRLEVRPVNFVAAVGIAVLFAACSQAPGSNGLSATPSSAVTTIDLNSVNDLITKGLASPHLAAYNAAMLQLSPTSLKNALANFVSDSPVSIGGHTLHGLKSRLMNGDSAALDSKYPSLKDMFAAAAVDPTHPFAKANFNELMRQALERLDPKSGSLALATVGGVQVAPSATPSSQSTACVATGITADVLGSNSTETKVTGEVASGACISAIVASCGADALGGGLAGSEVPGVGNIIGAIAGCGWGAGSAAAACGLFGAAAYNAPALAKSVDQRICNDQAATY